MGGEGGKVGGRRKMKGREHTTFWGLSFFNLFFPLSPFHVGPHDLRGTIMQERNSKIEVLGVTQRGGVLQGRWGKRNLEIF